MKIKMLTTKCGPVTSENWVEGQKRNVSPEEARYWHELGVCELLEPYPAEAEKAVVKVPEKAVVKPAETANVKPQTSTPVQATKGVNLADWGNK